MRINYQKFLSRTQKGLISPIYIFSGKDEFYKEKVVEKLKKSISRLDELNFTVFYGEDSTATDIIRVASTPPLTGDRQLIVVKNADKLRDKTPIENYSHSPSSHTCLVLLVIKNNYRFGDEVTFTPPSERECTGWITEQIKKRGWNISPQAAFELKERVGIDTMVLNGEIEKLITYCGSKKNIDLEDVRFLVGSSKETTVFNLTSAINKKDVKKALTILKKLPDSEKRIFINTIAWHMRRLVEAKIKIEHGDEVSAVCEEMRISPFFQYEFISSVRGLGWDKFKEIFPSILQVEFDFKSGRFSFELALELLVINLCN